MSSTHDQQILDLIKKVDSEKKAIAKIVGKPAYSTNGSFSFSEGRTNDSVNIRVERDLRVLISIANFVRGREVGYKEAAALLDVSNPPVFTWCGFSAEDWLNDLKVAVSKIQVGERQKKLDSLEARLNKLVSPEQRRELELKAIMEELG